MPTVRESVTTTLPIEAAFAYVADFENIVEWDPGVTRAHKTTDAPVGAGASFDLDLRYGRSDMAMTYTVTGFEAPTLVVLEGDGSRSHAVDRIRFTETDQGTRIDYEADIRLKGLFRLAQPFLTGLFDRIGEGARIGLTRRLNEIAAEIERGR